MIVRSLISLALAIFAVTAARMPLVNGGENPRAGAPHIDCGLDAESRHDFNSAERELLAAAQLDRQYLPAWTLANYYFRRGDRNRFLPWARRAAELCYDDLNPLLQLADAFDPGRATDELGGSAKQKRAYLDLLIRSHRWDEAMVIARNMTDSQSAERLRAFTTQLIGANRGAQAAEIWAHVEDHGDHAPTGEGFDWRIGVCNHMTGRWRDGVFEFTLDGFQPEVVTLLERPVFLSGPPLPVRYRYSSDVAGLHFAIDHKAGPAIENSVQAPTDWRDAEHTFVTREMGLARLVLYYRRDPGSVAAQGRIRVGNIH